MAGTVWGLPGGSEGEDRACLCQAQAEALLWFWLSPRSSGPALACSIQRPPHEDKTFSSLGKMSAYIITIQRCQLQHGHEKTVKPFTSEYLEAELTGDRGQAGFQPIKTNCPIRPAIWLLNGGKVSANDLGMWGRKGELPEDYPDKSPRSLVNKPV